MHQALTPHDARKGPKRGQTEEMALVTLPEKEGGAPACSPRLQVCGQRLVLERGPTGGWEEGGRESICLFTSTQKYFPHFQNRAFHRLISKQLGKKHSLSHPADEGLGSDQSRLASQSH